MPPFLLPPHYVSQRPPVRCGEERGAVPGRTAEHRIVPGAFGAMAIPGGSGSLRGDISAWGRGSRDGLCGGEERGRLFCVLGRIWGQGREGSDGALINRPMGDTVLLVGREVMALRCAREAQVGY